MKGDYDLRGILRKMEKRSEIRHINCNRSAVGNQKIFLKDDQRRP